MRDSEIAPVPFHPLSAIFPLMEGVAFRELVEDIRVHGLRDPIVLFDGAILDGRNRYRACHAAQVSARFETYQGKDAISYVVSVNLRRRHLDASQRAMVAAEIANLRVGAGPGRRKKPGRRDRAGRLTAPLKDPDRKPVDGAKYKAAQYQPGDDRISVDAAGTLLNVSGATVLQAKKVLSGGTPELIASVRAGEASVSSAAEVARLPKEQQNRILKSSGASAVAVIGQAARADRLESRRIHRAAGAESAAAVFDHVKIGDGRSIGNIRIGEVRRLAESLQTIVDVLFLVAGHVANAGHGERIRDVVKEATLAEMVGRATTAARARHG